MSKHTKGPWEYDREDGEYPMWIKGADGSEVLSGCGCCGSPNLGIDDARLIAAAPELLEALEAMVLFSPHTKSNAAALNAAISAIAKARGEA